MQPREGYLARLDIDAASWSTLSRLLDEALDREPADRAAWLEALGPEHEGLKPRLRDLLLGAGAVETVDFLHTMPKIGAAEARAAAGLAGDLVGPYRLLRELGGGGMGTVWLAERADGLIPRPVALKLPHLLSAQRAGLAERMAREREILATLDHRNIARLLDAGLTEAGQPYLALEYVEGMPLDQYCARGAGGEPLPLESRLKLFRQVADAVAYAHGKLVLHRDLKPANILVTAGGGVKLLDFGIAKLLDGGTAAETRLTELSGRALTPDYASPEQILGEPLTVASDVYSLGVILFELVTGARPYKPSRDSRGALEDAIVQAEPPRASQAAAEPFRKALRGDLDTIVARALKKSPPERFATVNAFAEDIERHLSNRPVLSRPDSGWYRLRKFVTRNRLAVGASGVMVIGIVAGSGVALWQMLEANTQRDIARQQLARAESVKNLMVQVFAAADPAAGGGRKLSAADLLGEASTRIAAMQISDPRVRAEILRVMGGSLLNIKSLDAADSMSQLALQAAAELGPHDEEYLRARLLRTRVYLQRGDTNSLRQELDDLLPELRRRVPPMQAELVEGLRMFAHLEIDASQYPPAVAWATEATEAAERAFGAESAEFSRSLTLLALTQVYARNRDDALVLGRRSYETALKAAGGNPAHPLVIESRISLARALDISGDIQGAVEQFELAIRDGAATWGETSTTVGHYLQNSASLYRRQGDLRKAYEVSQRALQIAEGDEVESRSFTMFTRRISMARSSLALRRYEEAARMFERVVAEPPETRGSNHETMLAVRSDLAFSLAMSGDIAAGEAMIGQVAAESAAANTRGAYLPIFAQGRIARRAGDAARAERFLEQALAPESRFRSEVDRANVMVELGLAQLGLRRTSEAEATLRAALALLKKNQRMTTPEQADSLLGLSRVALAQGRRSEAIAHAEAAAGFWREFAPDGADARETARWLAICRG